MTGGSLALVTGYPGWAGNRLVHFLRHPHPDWPGDRPAPGYDRVRCLVAAAVDRPAGDDVELVQGDLRDASSVARFTEGAEGADLFHFAGVIHPRRIAELEAINHLGTRTLIDHALAHGVRRMVALSSNSPVGVSRDPGTVFDEDTPCRPYLGYGRSKLAMEREIRTRMPEAVILRPCWFYGPDQPERQTLFFRMVREGKAPLVGGGHARRSLSYVDAIALAALLAMGTSEAAGRTYWIADPEPFPMHEVVDTIEAVLRDDFGLPVTGRRMRLPGVASDIAFAADAALQRAGLYQPKLHVLGEMNKTIACSSQRARTELGWHPGPGLREGMRRSVQWCLDQGLAI